MRFVLIGLIIIFSCLPQAHAKDKITWMVLDWPPWMIIEGEDAGKGRFNHILRVAQESLPDYDHATEKMNWARFWHDVKNNNNVCYPFGLKTGDREKLVYYSAPHTLVLPNAIIIKKSTLEKLGNPDKYSIIDLLKNNKLKGYAEKNRSFSEKVDTLLKKNKIGSNLTRVTESAESLIKMVLMGRIDYTIEYPIVAAYHEKKVGKPGTLTSIPIAEMEPFSYVYMNCTKNEWGKKVITKWNKALRKLKLTEEYRKITEMGHTDERELKLIRKVYDAFINEHN